ncbi:unnamed protein product [Cylicostephanus goldi]|uniref:Uncharacterized protein n=1 Tax=Cylicostephanus goldi TaxID=71465 RepID=A0A3P7NB21_CYLGO|nr:unnamed protein product [Cylicostephanus goldi]
MSLGGPREFLHTFSMCCPQSSENHSGVNPRLVYITTPLGNFFDLLSLINSAVNFVLCALMSHDPVYLLLNCREFLHTFSMCCPQSSENHSGAPITKTTKISLFTTLSSPFRKVKGFLPVPTSDRDSQQNNRVAGAL